MKILFSVNDNNDDLIEYDILDEDQLHFAGNPTFWDECTKVRDNVFKKDEVTMFTGLKMENCVDVMKEYYDPSKYRFEKVDSTNVYDQDLSFL